MDDRKRSDDGMAQRRKVLGEAWVDKSIAGKNCGAPGIGAAERIDRLLSCRDRSAQFRRFGH
jgi:hypothetical protein